jgi:hypothetical protein
MKSRQEVEELKNNWRNDPCWDIEQTDGFEEYRDELKTYRLDMVAKWRAQEYNRLFERARDLGIDQLGDKDNEVDLRLMRYLEGLERKITELNQVIENVYFRQQTK